MVYDNQHLMLISIEKSIDCYSCTAHKYCDVVVSSIKLCPHKKIIRKNREP